VKYLRRFQEAYLFSLTLVTAGTKSGDKAALQDPERRPGPVVSLMRINIRNLIASWTRLFFPLLLLASVGPSPAAQEVLDRTQSTERAQSKAVERAKYQINLKLNFDVGSYAGSERVRWINRGDHSTAALYFHLYSNLRVAQPTSAPGANSTSPVVAEADEPRIEVTEVRSAGDNERLTFVLDDQGTTLRCGSHYQLQRQRARNRPGRDRHNDACNQTGQRCSARRKGNTSGSRHQFSLSWPDATRHVLSSAGRSRWR